MNLKVAVIGGDRRTLYAAKELTKAGAHCCLYGLEGDVSGNCNGFTQGSCNAPYLLSEALQGAQAILLPVPVSRDGKTVFMPLSSKKTELKDLCKCLPEGLPVYGGNLPEELKKGRPYVDLLEKKEFTEANALPTAESALALAALNYEGLLSGSRCAIAGYGNIGKILARRLMALGVRVQVYARRAESRRQAHLSGMDAYEFKDLPDRAGDIDIFFNTVPFPLLDETVTPLFKEEALYMELASPPYGMNDRGREKLNCKHLMASGLPGKYSPLYAGKLIAGTILKTVQ